MRTLDIDVRPMQPFGAEVRGIDLAGEIAPERAEAILEAWRRHALLLFRSQRLTSEQLVRFARTFGPLSDVGEAPGGFNFISNVNPAGFNEKGEYTAGGGSGEGPLGFHFDHSFEARPLKGIVMHAVETPPPGNGGETVFCDVRAAVRMMPAELRERLPHLTVRHEARVDLTEEGQIRRTSHSERPLLLHHPATNEPIVLLSTRHAVRVLELEPDESAALLQEVAALLHRPEVIYAHSWLPGDVVVWDNLALQHARKNFDPSQRRHMARVQIGF